jgi:hypothetical protein
MSDREQAVLTPDDTEVDQRELEMDFTRALLAMCDRFEKELEYSPKVLRRLLSEGGGVAAARQLVNTGPNQSGLDRLWEHGRLDQSLEAHVLLPEYTALFSDRERRKARRRLEDHGFDVTAYLRDLAEDP